MEIKLFSKLLIILSIAISYNTDAQNKTYLGVEFGPKFEIYHYTDNGSGLYTKPFFYNPIYGLTLGQEINKTFIAETGFYINDYGESYRIKGNMCYSMSNAIVAYQIPLRLKAQLDLIKEKLSITTTIGYTFAINNDYGSSGSGSSFTSTSGQNSYNDSTRTEDISNRSLQKTYGLVEAGISFDYNIKNSLILYLAANYMTGFNKIVEIDVKYWINDFPEQTATVFSNGDYYSIVFGVKYSISNFWTKRTEE